MARIRNPSTAERIDRASELSIAWRVDGERGRRRIALVVANPPQGRRFDHLSRRDIATRFGHLDRRLAVGARNHEYTRWPLTRAEVLELADLVAIADRLQSSRPR